MTVGTLCDPLSHTYDSAVHKEMSFSEVGTGNDMQIWWVLQSVLNKKLRTAEKGLLLRRNSFVREDIVLTTATTRGEAFCLKEWQLTC